MRPIREVIVHCTATVEGKDYSVAEIRAWHKARGWSDIGYHWVVHLDGTIEAGRPEAQVGSHVAGHNTGTIGIVYVGGVDAQMRPKDTRTPEQKAALLKLLRDLMARFPAISMISGHHDYAAKACPCFPAREEYAHLLGNKSLPSHPGAAIGAGTVKASKLNLRRSPNGEVMGQMPKGTALVIHGADGDWLNVQTPAGYRGWASRNHVSII